MGKHSRGDNRPFFRGLVLFALKWLGIAVLPALAVFGLLALVFGDEPERVETAPDPTVGTTESPVPSPPASPPAEPVEKGPIQILNGTSRPGLAASAQEELQNAGYEIAAIGDASGRYQRTTVFYQPGEERFAQQVAEFLGAEVTSPAPENLARNIPLTVVLGDDFRA